MLNELVLGASRLTGLVLGAIVGIPIGLLGMVVGIKPVTCIEAAACKGEQIACVVVGAVIGISEIARAQVVNLLNIPVSTVQAGGKLVGQTVGGIVDILTNFSPSAYHR